MADITGIGINAPFSQLSSLRHYYLKIGSMRKHYKNTRIGLNPFGFVGWHLREPVKTEVALDMDYEKRLGPMQFV